MTIRHALRRVNRGIVLAIVLVVGLTGYLIYDNVRFDSERIAIRETMSRFAKEANELNMLPEEEQIPGQAPTQATINKKLQENDAVLTKYLGYGEHSYSGIEQATRSLRDVFTQNAQRKAYITDCVYTVKSMKDIQKNGPRHALAEVTLHMEVKTIGKPVFFNLISTHDTQWDYHGEAPSQEEVDTKTYSYTQEFTLYNVQLEKTGGQWKIVQSGGWGYYGSGKLVEI